MIVATIFLAILASGVVVLGLRNASSREQVSRTVPALVTFGLLALLTAFFALGDVFDALLPGDLDPLESVAALEAEAPFDEGEAVLFVGESATFTEYRATDVFDMTLDDGDFALTGDAYIASGWSQEDERTTLDAGEPVVVLARYTGSGLTFESRLIYVGTHESFLDFVPRFLVIPVITMVSSIVLALICFALPVIYYRRFPKERS